MAQLTCKYLAIHTNTVADWWQVVVRGYPKDIFGYRGALQTNSWSPQNFGFLTIYLLKYHLIKSEISKFTFSKYHLYSMLSNFRTVKCFHTIFCDLRCLAGSNLYR